MLPPRVVEIRSSGPGPKVAAAPVTHAPAVRPRTRTALVLDTVRLSIPFPKLFVIPADLEAPTPASTPPPIVFLPAPAPAAVPPPAGPIVVVESAIPAPSAERPVGVVPQYLPDPIAPAW
jgi:hypothetical protein